MRLTLQQFVSLDGVTQGPGSPDEDTTGGFDRGGWFVPHLDDTFIGIVTEWVDEADAFLLGRRTYEGFADAWPKRTDPDDRIATQLNGRPKYVASTTLQKGSWDPTTVLSDDVEARVAALKAEPGREIQIHGSTTLARSMLAAGLVDELRLAVAPVLVGTGRRLFVDGIEPVGLRPIRNETTPGGLAVQVYEVAGAPQFGTYGA